MPTFLIYHIGSKTAFPHTFASPSVTSGTNTAFCALFSPQVSHQENANLPLAAGSALQNRLAPLDRLAPVARLLNPSQLRYSPFQGHTAHLRGLCPRMTPAAPGLPIPLRYIPASAVALRRDFRPVAPLLRFSLETSLTLHHDR